MVKVFGIGLSRTGTQSLAIALRMLGYKTIHYPRTVLEIDAHDAACDIPVLRRFRELDALYPGARFVWTTRAIGPWLESCRKHFGEDPARNKPVADLTAWEREAYENDLAVYGSIRFDEPRWTAARARWEREVGEHFRNRQDQLLTIDLTATPSADCWRRLMAFLGQRPDDIPFPWENRSQP